MGLAVRPWAADLLHFWFHTLRPAQWYRGGEAVDALLARRFAPLVGPLSFRPAGEYLTDPHTARAAILLFDQVPRNCFRGSEDAFATDALARELTYGAVARGWHGGLPKDHAQFVLLPLMHSEIAADQRESLRQFAKLRDPLNLRFARAHAAMIFRFGRFPHRNTVLGRTSTPAEDRAVAAGNAW